MPGLLGNKASPKEPFVSQSYKTSFKTRVTGDLHLTSPVSGTSFTAKWIKGERSADKKLALFNFPNIKGTVGQDLELNGTMYPMEFYFEGHDHDRVAKAFFDACAEIGQWSIKHPAFGFFTAQLSNIRQMADPVGFANATQFSGQWVELIDPETLMTGAEARALKDTSKEEVDELLIRQFNDDMSFLESALEGMRGAVDRFSKTVDKVLGPIAQVNDTISSTLQAVQLAMQDTLYAAVMKPLSLGGQIMQTVALPGLIQTDISSRMTGYKELATQMFSPEDAANFILWGSPTYSNIALFKAFAGSVIVRNTASMIGGTTVDTKDDAIRIAQEFLDMYSDIVGWIEEDEAKWSGETIDKQFLGNTLSYRELSRYVWLILRDFLLSAWNSQTVREYVVNAPISPFDAFNIGYQVPQADKAKLSRGRIVPMVNGKQQDEFINPTENTSFSLSDNRNINEKYQFFLDSNKLVGNELMVINAGRVLRFYG